MEQCIDVDAFDDDISSCFPRFKWGQFAPMATVAPSWRSFRAAARVLVATSIEAGHVIKNHGPGSAGFV